MFLSKLNDLPLHKKFPPDMKKYMDTELILVCKFKEHKCYYNINDNFFIISARDVYIGQRRYSYIYAILEPDCLYNNFGKLISAKSNLFVKKVTHYYKIEIKSKVFSLKFYNEKDESDFNLKMRNIKLEEIEKYTT